MVMGGLFISPTPPPQKKNKKIPGVNVCFFSLYTSGMPGPCPFHLAQMLTPQ